jgi:hypothetical protein
MSIKTNGTGSRLTVDLTTTHDIVIASEPMTMAFWCKHTTNFADFEGFGAIAASTNDRSDAVETHNGGVSGATGQFGASVNSSGIGLTAPNLPVNTWFYVMISRPAGGTTTDALIRVRISGANTNHTTLNWTHTGPFRFITLGDLAAFGLVTGATAEFAHLRVWRTLINQEADFTAESASATPVITSGLILSLPMDSRTQNTDQGPNGFTLTETGTITNGASDPPPGPAGSGSAVTGSGAVTVSAVTVTGAGVLRHTASGAPVVSVATVAATGVLRHTGTGALTVGTPAVSGGATLNGSPGTVVGVGALTASVGTSAGAGIRGSKDLPGSINLTASVPTLSGTATLGSLEGISGSGAFAPTKGIITGSGVLRHRTSTSNAINKISTVAGAAVLRHTASGALTVSKSIIAGTNVASNNGRRRRRLGLGLN